MLSKPKQVFGSLAAIAVVLLVLTLVGGSSGTVEGEVDLLQQIANVTMPLFILTLLVMAVLGAVYLTRRRKS